jgi:hypothetical protein
MGNEMDGEGGGYSTVVMMINPPRIFAVMKI